MAENKTRAARLAAKLRPTMPTDVLRLWADDAAAELRRLEASEAALIEALEEARKFAHHHVLIEGAAYGSNYSSTRSERARAAKASIDAAIACAKEARHA